MTGPMWKRWFAWFPVRIMGNWVWLLFVDRFYWPGRGWQYSFCPLELDK